MITHEKWIGFKRSHIHQRLAAFAHFCVWFAVLLGWCAIASSAAAENASIKAFYGTYKGEVFNRDGGESTSRDTRVSIHPHGTGFNVSWTTAKADGSRKSYAIDFEATKRPGIFGSAMRRNKFGDSVPLDPLHGDPYIWSRITGQTLTVYSFVITPEGSYDMQVYHRTLTDKGMELEFFRYLEGEPMRLIKGTLVKVDD